MRHASIPSKWFALRPERGWNAEFWIAVAHAVDEKGIDRDDDDEAVKRVIVELEAHKGLAQLIERAKNFYKGTR